MKASHKRMRALMDVLESDGARTAESLADELGVSVRTLYRDVRRLKKAGVAVQSKSGVGIRLTDKAERSDDHAELGVQVRVKVTPRGLRALKDDPALSFDRGKGEERVVRAASREAIVAAVLASAGEAIVVGPDRVRRLVRSAARAIARAHKR